ncbi:hypothetical protein PybrP1_006655 [[Pythium] brassicae (nom. inval.)]|nr:hypothetical protein PybrP1_006655 [[Pythium] brassicae (nom. inval.)]
MAGKCGFLGRTLSSQQACNIIQRMQTLNSAEVKLRALLERLVQSKDNHVMLVQDQLDITCALAMQTSAKKRAFQEWGECLVMDWMHGTNSLGYHLGSLIVTSVFGRGIPVFDFISLNQKASTTTETLNYFKSKNKTRASIETVTIEKDFTEWRVLERCFVAAKVLLCQYQAITNWRKTLQRHVFNLTAATHDDLEDHFLRMLKW